MFRPFTGQNPAAPKSSNGIGSFELYRKFYAVEEYSEVAKMFRRFILTLMEGEKYSLEIFPPGHALLRYSNAIEMLPMKKQKLD